MRVTKQELEARANEALKQAYVLESALSAALNGEVQWIDKQKLDADDNGPAMKYQFGVARLTSANGGLFFTRFACKGQSDSFTVHYLDNVISECRNNPASEYSVIRAHALELAVSMRYKALEAAK